MSSSPITIAYFLSLLKFRRRELSSATPLHGRPAPPNPQPTQQFLSNVLSQRGPSSLPYSEDVKRLIRHHLVTLGEAFPSIQPRTATYTHNDGRTVNCSRLTELFRWIKWESRTNYRQKLQYGAVSFYPYLRTVRSLSREQFVHFPTIAKIKYMQMQSQVANMGARTSRMM